VCNSIVAQGGACAVSVPGVSGDASRIGWLTMLLAVVGARTARRRRGDASRSLASSDRTRLVRAASRARTTLDP
jgi:MYXO-CTERM domain-containing protein